MPDRFLVRRPEEFAAELDNVGAHYWYRMSTGDVPNETALGMYIKGAYLAMNWLSGTFDTPPGYHSPRLRTRYDLIDVLRIVELACNDEIDRWEDIVKGGQGGADEYIPRGLAGGARGVYEWALGIRAQPPLEPLLAEERLVARDFFAKIQRKLAEQDEPRYRAA